MSVTTHNVMIRSQARDRSLDRRQPGLFARIADVFRTWRQRIRDRQAFVHLDQRDLRDMGLSRWEVESELAKPFWRE